MILGWLAIYIIQRAERQGKNFAERWQKGSQAYERRRIHEGTELLDLIVKTEVGQAIRPDEALCDIYQMSRY